MVLLTTAGPTFCAQLLGTPLLLLESQKQSRNADLLAAAARPRLPTQHRTHGPGLLVWASACCPPRPGTRHSSKSRLLFEPKVARGKVRRRGSGGSSGDDGSDGWDDSNLWHGGFGGDSGGSDGNNGGYWSSWGPSGGNDPFQNTIFECMWLWQVLCVASLLRSACFLLCPQQGMNQQPHSSVTDLVMPPQVTMAC